ncbi:MAG: transcriptional regulator [Anaerolineales bacterium]|nr:transcriptional regulator [Anaerolineales bacterium]
MSRVDRLAPIRSRSLIPNPYHLFLPRLQPKSLQIFKDARYVNITKGFRGNYPHTTGALTKDGRRAFDAYRKQYLALAQHLKK